MQHHRTLFWFGGAVLLLSGITTTLHGDPSVKPTARLADRIALGSAVAVQDVGSALELTLYEDGSPSLGYTVVESTTEYVVLRDLAGVTEKVIPWWSIKSIIVLRPISQNPIRGPK